MKFRGSKMKPDPNKTYVILFIGTDGRQHWSKPILFHKASSINVKRETFEDLFDLLWQFGYPKREHVASYQVFEIPEKPVFEGKS